MFTAASDAGADDEQFVADQRKANKLVILFQLFLELIHNIPVPMV